MEKNLNRIDNRKIQKSCCSLFQIILRIWFRKGKVLIESGCPADACTTSADGNSIIYMQDANYANCGSPLNTLKGKDLVLFLFGLFCHELFHLFYSDFEYPTKAVNEIRYNRLTKFPNIANFVKNMSNVNLVYRFINTIEDGHIERRGKLNYALYRRYIDFMNKVYFGGKTNVLTDTDINKEKFNQFVSYFNYALRLALTGKSYDLTGCPPKFQTMCQKNRILILDAVYENDKQKRIDKALKALDEALGDLPKSSQTPTNVGYAEKALENTQNSQAQKGMNSTPNNDVENQTLEKPQRPQDQQIQQQNEKLKQKTRKSKSDTGEQSEKSEAKSNQGEKSEQTTQMEEAETDEGEKQDVQSQQGECQGEASETQNMTGPSQDEEAESGNTQSASSADVQSSDFAGNTEDTVDEPYDFDDDQGLDLDNDFGQNTEGGTHGGTGDSEANPDNAYEDSIVSQIEKDLEEEFQAFEEDEALVRELDRTVKGKGNKSRFTELVNRRTLDAVPIEKSDKSLSDETRRLLNKYIDQTVRKVSEEVKTRTEDGMIPYQLNGRFNSARCADFITKTGVDRFRLFDRMTEGEEGLDIAVELLIDESGSMNGKQNEVIAISVILQGICSKLCIPIRVASFNGSNTNVFAEFDAPQQPKSFENRITRYEPRGGTNEGQILQLFEKSFAERPETCKYLFLITDGEPGGFIDRDKASELGIESEEDWLRKYQVFLKKQYGIQMVACCTGLDAINVASIYTGAKIIFNDYASLAKRLTEEFLRPLKT